MSEKIVIISGPTASGKSGLALELAQKKDIAIINADSLQIYQGLPILSSQPSSAEQKLVPHFLYSHLQAQENSSVALWLKLLEATVVEVIKQNRLPVIVGGSGMYISKLVEGISEIPSISDEIKQQAKNLYDQLGHEEFKAKFGNDKIIDKQRLIRACEVLLQTEKPISFWQNNHKKIFPNANFLHINLQPNRDELYHNCNQRFELMFKNGAIAEVQNLLKQSLNDEMQITKTLGFYEIRDFLNGEISATEAIKKAQQKTRNYAKRQLTWFRNQLPQKHVFADNKAALIFLQNEI